MEFRTRARESELFQVVCASYYGSMDVRSIQQRVDLDPDYLLTHHCIRIMIPPFAHLVSVTKCVLWPS